MRTRFVTCMLALFFATFVFADPVGHVIQLVPIASSVFVGGNNPLGNPEQGGIDPVQPTDFLATIDGDVLYVSNESLDIVDVMVTDLLSNEVIVSTPLSDELLEVLPQGEYQLDIITENFTLEGFFEVEE